MIRLNGASYTVKAMAERIKGRARVAGVSPEGARDIWFADLAGPERDMKALEKALRKEGKK